MFISIFYKKIYSLNGDVALNDISFSALKKQTEILIIDDEEFSYLDALKKHEYNLTQKSDLTDLRDAEAYQIILCDIRGVGKFLESDFGGAYLIKQLKEKYPEKTIIAYTANDYNAKFQQYLNFADDIVPKGAFALEDWTSLLDKLLKEYVNPVKIWERTRKTLIDAGVSTIDIAKFESDYVSAIKKGKFESFKKIYEKRSNKGSDIMLSLFKILPSIVKIIEGV
jgi:hypothetical protein